MNTEKRRLVKNYIIAFLLKNWKSKNDKKFKFELTQYIACKWSVVFKQFSAKQSLEKVHSLPATRSIMILLNK